MTETIVLGLDGATWDVLTPLIDEGRLPNLSELLETGTHGTLRSTFPPITAPAWLSMATSQNPGKTGVFYFLNRESPDSYDFTSLGSDAFEGKSFWDVLSARGQSVGIFNFPMLYPPYEVDGFMVSGLGSPEDETITYPDSLYQELVQVTSGYEIKVPYADPKYVDRPDALSEELHRVLELRAEATEHLLLEKDPDVFFGVISVTDWAQHYFWRYYDATHPLHPDGTEPRHEDAIGRLWESVDDVVGRVNEIAKSEDANLLLVSDHGFGPVTRTFHSNDWLDEAGFKIQSEQGVLGRLGSTYFPYLRRIGEPIVSALPWLNDLATSVGRSIKQDPADVIDWERSVAFAPRQNLTSGMLYVLSDDPAEEKAVSDGLESLRAPDGTDLDVSVYKPPDRYHGPKTDLAPDLMFTIEDYACAIDPRPGTGDIFTSGPPSAARSGGHREEGIYVVAGPDAAESEGEERELLDVAPTVLALQDVPVPREMDGRPMVDVFPTIQSESPDSRPSLDELVEVSGDGDNTDTESVEKRLDDLGYI